MPIDDFCTVKIASHTRAASFSEADLKFLAQKLHVALSKRGFECNPVFGSSTDLWMFTVLGDPTQADSQDIDVGISPEPKSESDYWSVQVHLQDAGWLKSTRERRLTQLGQIEWAVHAALKDDMGGKIVEWHVGPGRIRAGHGTPTPRPAKQ